MPESEDVKPKPLQKAVALRYAPDLAAPKVVAKGKGFLAQKLLEQAAAHNVPSYKDAKLAEELTRLDIGEYIPPELYEVVAQILIFISELDKLESYTRHER